MLRLVVDNTGNETKKELPVLNSSYSEASYFDGYHFQHIAEWQEAKRLTRIRNEARKMMERRLTRRTH